MRTTFVVCAYFAVHATCSTPYTASNSQSHYSGVTSVGSILLSWRLVDIMVGQATICGQEAGGLRKACPFVLCREADQGKRGRRVQTPRAPEGSSNRPRGREDSLFDRPCREAAAYHRRRTLASRCVCKRTAWPSYNAAAKSVRSVFCAWCGDILLVHPAPPVWKSFPTASLRDAHC